MAIKIDDANSAYLAIELSGKLTAEDRSDILPRGAARDRAPENEPVAVQDRRRETAADAAGRTGKTNSHCDLSSA